MMLRETRLPVRAISSSVGYRTYEAFERAYRKRVGKTPQATRLGSGDDG
jgi:transcriptional regulator GlxA family with amidase domain